RPTRLAAGVRPGGCIGVDRLLGNCRAAGRARHRKASMADPARWLAWPAMLVAVGRASGSSRRTADVIAEAECSPPSVRLPDRPPAGGSRPGGSWPTLLLAELLAERRGWQRLLRRPLARLRGSGAAMAGGPTDPAKSGRGTRLETRNSSLGCALQPATRSLTDMTRRRVKICQVRRQQRWQQQTAAEAAAARHEAGRGLPSLDRRQRRPHRGDAAHAGPPGGPAGAADRGAAPLPSTCWGQKEPEPRIEAYRILNASAALEPLRSQGCRLCRSVAAACTDRQPSAPSNRLRSRCLASSGFPYPSEAPLPRRRRANRRLCQFRRRWRRQRHRTAAARGAACGVGAASGRLRTARRRLSFHSLGSYRSQCVSGSSSKQQQQQQHQLAWACCGGEPQDPGCCSGRHV
uniref:Serine/arginine repetitive matrix protein 2 n=1 Tax=Macrostomum lignano TaxID=282301 RepID=A0A1I8FLG8_9PLAT